MNQICCLLQSDYAPQKQIQVKMQKQVKYVPTIHNKTSLCFLQIQECNQQRNHHKQYCKKANALNTIEQLQYIYDTLAIQQLAFVYHDLFCNIIIVL